MGPGLPCACQVACSGGCSRVEAQQYSTVQYETRHSSTVRYSMETRTTVIKAQLVEATPLCIVVEVSPYLPWRRGTACKPQVLDGAENNGQMSVPQSVPYCTKAMLMRSSHTNHHPNPYKHSPLRPLLSHPPALLCMTYCHCCTIFLRLFLCNSTCAPSPDTQQQWVGLGLHACFPHTQCLNTPGVRCPFASSPFISIQRPNVIGLA